MAWAKQLLRVDLSKGTCTNEPLNMEWAQNYLGQRGLATKYYVEECDPKVDPLSPDNKMIMTTGAVDRHLCVDGGPLFGGYQGRADGRHCVLQLGRFLRQRNEERRLRHDHLRRQVG